MQHHASLQAQIWRAIALGLFIVLVWQIGNAALMPPRAPVAGADEGTRPPYQVPPTVIAVPITPETPPGTPDLPPAAKPVLWRVGNTGGEGVYLRSRPRMADRVRAWPDGTLMQATGQETEAEGRRWIEVVDPAGTVGWIPAAYLVRA
jgi:hypothetical protein